MGAGSSGLIWYGMCCAGVSFTFILAVGLVFWGQQKQKKQQAAKQRKTNQS